MSMKLFRSSLARSALKPQLTTKPIQPRLVGLGFVRGKATLPDLPCKLALDVQMFS